MDPEILLGSEEFIRKEVEQIINDFWGTRHIFNLGDGLLPISTPESV